MPGGHERGGAVGCEHVRALKTHMGPMSRVYEGPMSMGDREVGVLLHLTFPPPLFQLHLL